MIILRRSDHQTPHSPVQPAAMPRHCRPRAARAEWGVGNGVWGENGRFLLSKA
ncbi:MAG: hypothetical protein KDE56_15705 [Anaerolineales bacterium]|nr:hypothetical protein [Anaerolineales bacterium]